MRSRARWILFALLVVLLVALFGRTWFLGAKVPAGSHLLLEISGAYPEAPPADVFERVLRRQQRSLIDLLTLLKKAAADDRIDGIVLRVGNLQVGWAKAQDIRDALIKFKASGKRLVAYLQQEVLSGNLEYYVASVADQVYFPPGGTTPLNGLLSQFFFLGGVWEKLDIEMNVEKIREYKTAGDMLTNKTMTPKHREMANSLLDSVNAQFVAGIAESRRLDTAAVQAIINECPIEPAAFTAAGLGSGVKFLDQLREELVGPDRKFLDASDYEPEATSSLRLGSRPALAVIYAVGAIQTGEGADGVSGQSAGSDSLIEAFDTAAADGNVKAIVFRIDSPGGSALASDLIWRAAQRARSKKPVIVSMSDVAGSGGYYIAAGGSQIVAQPATFTGSIGVVVAKPNIRGFLAKLGITTETLTRGKYARLEDTTSSLTRSERAKVVAAMEHVYGLFIDRVAEGRHLTRERVDEIGRGRVWTGAQAKENGLVDELGGFTRAIELAKQAAGLPVDQEVPVVFYPRRKSVIERLAQYVEARTAVSLPAAWERLAGATLAPWMFPEGTMLTLMAEAIEIR